MHYVTPVDAVFPQFFIYRIQIYVGGVQFLLRVAACNPLAFLGLLIVPIVFGGRYVLHSEKSVNGIIW